MDANTKIADSIQAHSIDLERFSVDLQNRILPVLDRLERSLTAEIAEIDPTGGRTKTNREARKEALLEQTRGTIATSYKAIKKTVGDDLQDIAKLSDTAGRKIVNDAVGVEIMTVAIAPEQLRALADGTLVQGAVVKEHWDRQSEDLRRKFQDRVQDGFLRGEPSTEIINRVRGTKARGYADGIMNTTKSAAGALVRTSVQSVANNARLEVFKGQEDILKGVEWLSTLDNRTCLVGDTLLQTPSGFRRIDDIQVGDVVIGGSGQERRVLATPRSQAPELMKVTLDNGQTIVCTPDHRFLVEINGKQVWRDAENLFNGDDIASIMKVLAD